MTDFLEHPNKELWESRQRWFEEVSESYAGKGAYMVSDQACALIGEVQTAFCAGAWVAVIVLAMVVVDAQLRETELPGFRGNTRQLLIAADTDLICSGFERDGMQSYTLTLRIQQLPLTNNGQIVSSWSKRLGNR